MLSDSELKEQRDANLKHKVLGSEFSTGLYLNIKNMGFVLFEGEYMLMLWLFLFIHEPEYFKYQGI